MRGAGSSRLAGQQAYGVYCGWSLMPVAIAAPPRLVSSSRAAAAVGALAALFDLTTQVAVERHRLVGRGVAAADE